MNSGLSRKQGLSLRKLASILLLFASLDAAAQWQQGLDFRNTSTFVTDPSGDTYVLPTTQYPTTVGGVTFGWLKTSLVTGRDRNATLDPRLAGINFVDNGSPATFYVDLPSAGTYNVSLAMGDAGYEQCWKECQVQFLDGSTVLAMVTGGFINLGFFYDADGNKWSAAQWPASNLSQQMTLSGTRLTVLVGTSKATGDATPIAFLGVTQVSGGSPNYSISALPSSVTIQQGDQGTSTITTSISGGFNSAISMSASGVPSDTAVSFSPNPIPAPGAGNSTMTITVGSSTPTGAYPITVTGDGGGIEQNTTVTVTVTVQQQPSFTISASPASLSIAQGNQENSTITTTISGGFNSAISLSAAGVPSGTTVSFNPQTIPAPGSGSSTMTVTVGSGTPTGTYPITVTGNGGGIQQNSTVTLTVLSSSWAIGFDFRASSNYITDPAGDTYVLPTTTYPTMFNGVNFGWTNVNLLQARNRSTGVDPRLAGMNFAINGSPATFYVDLPASGTYNLSLALGDEGYLSCSVQCQIQFLDDSTILATLTKGSEGAGYFYDVQGNNWSAANWPTNNVDLEVAIAGSRLTMVVGTNQKTGDYTPIAFLGVTEVTLVPNFLISAAPTSLSVAQGNQVTSTMTTTISGGFNSAITLSASGLPSGATVSFNPNPIRAPDAGTSTITITVGPSTPVGTYPIIVTGNGEGVQQSTTVTLNVTPTDFILTASPPTVTVAQGSAGNTTARTTLLGIFNSVITLSASGIPSGTTVTFNPNPIPAPGGGASTMTIMVGANTPFRELSHHCDR